MAGNQWLTYDQFEGRVGEGFAMAADDGSGTSLELVEVTHGSEVGGPDPDGAQRMQFSLVFLAPGPRVWPQGIYRLSHVELGDLELFLVPLGADARGVRYEAAFA